MAARKACITALCRPHACTPAGLSLSKQASTPPVRAEPVEASPGAPTVRPLGRDGPLHAFHQEIHLEDLLVRHRLPRGKLLLATVVPDGSAEGLEFARGDVLLAG